jgi:hypothetical protein
MEIPGTENIGVRYTTARNLRSMVADISMNQLNELETGPSTGEGRL